MPRKPRLFLSHQPQHIVIRGHNRDPILARVEDFRFLYRCLFEAAEKNNLKVHAWVFMHNHLHLLVTPEAVESLPRTMQSVGRRYAQYFNRTYRRSGSLWEGRYKSSIVDTDHYLICCYRYIELNPVRAGLVRFPEEYAYSSYQANALGKEDKLITPHAVFSELIKLNNGSKPKIDRQAYIDLFAQHITRKDLVTIRRGTEKGLGIGQANFLLRIAALTSC